MPRTLSRVSRAPSWIAGVVLVAGMALLLPRSAAAQASALEQAALVKDLAGRDWLKRFDAASAILGLYPAQRDPATIAAVVKEIRRLQRLKGHGVDELPPAVKDRNAARTYYDNLLDIIAESHDPIVIPALIGAADDNYSAQAALAEFGETALPQILTALRPGSEPEQAAGLLHALGRMFERQSLTAESLASIVEIDRRYLSAGQSEVVERAIDLAVVLNEPPLIARLTTIAHARTEKDAALMLTDPQNLLRVAAVAREALAKIDGPQPMRSEEVLLEDLRSPLGRVANDAAAEMLSAPASARTPAMVAALVVAMPRLRHTDDDRGGECGFYCELIDLAVKADDPALIPVLVKAVDVGAPIEWLAKRGEAAAPAVAAEALQSTDPAHLSDGLRIFQLMLERHATLSAASRASIASVVLRQLSSRHTSNVNLAIEVAALLGDASLAPRLKEIADARTMADAKLDPVGVEGADRARALSQLSAAAAKALARMR